ncbi:MAG: hypothetical protein ACJ789_16710 [Thermomicrobiales bacterium]
MKSKSLRGVMMATLVLIVLPLMSGLQADASEGPPRYAITELAALELYHGFQEFDINNDGAVLANDLSFDTFTPTVHVYQAGRKARELKGGSEGARGFGINDRGEVVGEVYDSDPDTGAQLTQAVLWRDGKMTRLLAPDDISLAWDINNAGDIICRSQSSQDDPHPKYLILANRSSRCPRLSADGYQ